MFGINTKWFTFKWFLGDYEYKQAVIFTIFFMAIAFALGHFNHQFSNPSSLQLIMFIFLFFFSGNFFYSMVGDAIKAEKDKTEKRVKQEIRQNMNLIQKEQEIDMKFEIYTNQKDSNFLKDTILKIPLDKLKSYRDLAVAREVFLNLIYWDKEENPFKIMSIEGSIIALKKQDQKFDPEEIEKNKKFQILQEDIFIYLRAWIFCSILYGREMSIAPLPKRYIDENDDPNVYTEALKYIKDFSLNQLFSENPKVKSYWDEEKRKIAKKVIQFYLGQLIIEIEKNTSDHLSE